MYDDFPEGDPQRFTPDPGDPSDHNRLSTIQRLLRFHGFHVSADDIWGDPRSPVVIRVDGWDEEIKDYALIREAVASGIHDPHTLVSLYASDLHDRRRWRQRRRPRGAGES
jgi:hypothetical protein